MKYGDPTANPRNKTANITEFFACPSPLASAEQTTPELNSAGWLSSTLTDVSPRGLGAASCFALSWRLRWAGPSKMAPAVQGMATNECQSIPWPSLQLGN